MLAEANRGTRSCLAHGLCWPEIEDFRWQILQRAPEKSVDESGRERSTSEASLLIQGTAGGNEI